MTTKKYALERALDAFKASPGTIAASQITLIAQSFEDFLTGQPLKQNNAPGMMAQPANGKAVMIPARLKDISSTVRHTLKTAIEMHYQGDVVNGSALGRILKMSQSNASLHLNKLIASGHMRRVGNKFTPIYNYKGEAVSAIIRQLPAANAKGYKPMTQRIGSISRAH